MTLMTFGLYNEPAGAYLPSILYSGMTGGRFSRMRRASWRNIPITLKMRRGTRDFVVRLNAGETNETTETQTMAVSLRKRMARQGAWPMQQKLHNVESPSV